MMIKNKLYFDASGEPINIPLDEDSRHEEKNMKAGTEFVCIPIEQYENENKKKKRNCKFTRKYFKLLDVSFNYWQPTLITQNGYSVEKDFDRFRADITILAGYYKHVCRTDGSIRVEPQSVSFIKMDEETFNKLYKRTKDIIWEKILPELSEKDRINFENELLEF